MYYKAETLLCQQRSIWSKLCFFPVVMYGCESWIIKKDEHQRIDAFELWCWRRLFESPLYCKEIKPVNPKGNQPWIFIGGTDAELKLQYFGNLMWRADSLEKTLMLGKIKGRRRRGQQRIRWLDGITNSMDMSLSKLRRQWRTGKPGVLQSTGSQRVGHDWLTEQQTRHKLRAPMTPPQAPSFARMAHKTQGNTLPTFTGLL